MNMPKIITCGLLLLFSSAFQAQIVVNAAPAPAWGPAGYAQTEYYYLPDIESYYDVKSTEFIYYGNGNWVRSRRLPAAHRRYDLYNGYKVVLTDYHGPAPYTLYKTHKIKYYKGYKGGPQKTIGIRPVKIKKHGNGHGHGGHGKGHNKH